MMRKYLLQLVFWVLPTQDIGNEYESVFIMDTLIYINIHIANAEAQWESDLSAIRASRLFGITAYVLVVVIDELITDKMLVQLQSFNVNSHSSVIK